MNKKETIYKYNKFLREQGITIPVNITKLFFTDREKVKREITKSKALKQAYNIYDIACKFFNADINTPKQDRYYVDSRVIFCAYLKKNNIYVPLKKIGEILNKNHATIIHYYKIYDNLLFTNDKEFSNILNKFEEYVTQHKNN